jgi:hypothetical protein
MRAIIALICYMLVHQNLLAAMREREIRGACYVKFETIAPNIFDTLCGDLMTYRHCMSWVDDLEKEFSRAEISMTYSWKPKQRCKAIASN